MQILSKTAKIRDIKMLKIIPLHLEYLNCEIKRNDASAGVIQFLHM